MEYLVSTASSLGARRGEKHDPASKSRFSLYRYLDDVRLDHQPPQVLPRTPGGRSEDDEQ